MTNQNILNNNFLTANAGFPLPGLQVINANQVISSSGFNDIYTVPSGRRAILTSMWAVTQSSTVGATPAYKIGSTYFNGAGGSVALSTTTPQNIVSLIPLILESGEVLSVYLASAISVNLWPVILEVDNSCVIKSSKTGPLTSGNNLCYTCPAGKSALILDPRLNFGAPSASAIGAIGSANATYLQYVPNGQSPGSTFRISNNVTSGTTGGGTSASSVMRGPSLNAGDMIYANAASSLQTQVIFNVAELSL